MEDEFKKMLNSKMSTLRVKDVLPEFDKDELWKKIAAKMEPRNEIMRLHAMLDEAYAKKRAETERESQEAAERRRQLFVPLQYAAMLIIGVLITVLYLKRQKDTSTMTAGTEKVRQTMPETAAPPTDSATIQQVLPASIRPKLPSDRDYHRHRTALVKDGRLQTAVRADTPEVHIVQDAKPAFVPETGMQQAVVVRQVPARAPHLSQVRGESRKPEMYHVYPQQPEMYFASIAVAISSFGFVK